MFPARCPSLLRTKYKIWTKSDNFLLHKKLTRIWSHVTKKENVSLTQHSYKRLPFSRIWFSNFKIFFRLVPWSWYLKYIYIWMTPFGPLYGGPGDPNVPKKTKAHLMYWNHFRRKSPKILCLFEPQIQNFTEFPDNWENWEFFANFGFWNF